MNTSVGCAAPENGSGNDGQSGSVHHEEHDHRIGGCVFLGIELLQLLHGFEAGGGCGIVKAQHVGSDVHKDAAHGRMVLGNVRKQPGEYWT